MHPFHYHLRLYCERTGDGLWGEPFNVASSVSFLIAAFLLWRLYRDYRIKIGPAPEIPILIIITALIGIGSVIFHSEATMWAVFFDVIPIVFFVFFYLYIFARSLLGLGIFSSAALFALLIAVNMLFKSYVPRAFDGYISYLPTFLFLLLLALYMLIKRHASALRITAAASLALLSLYCRAMDRSLCNVLPMGTHFLWHILNALLIYILVRELMLYGVYSSAGRTHGHT